MTPTNSDWLRISLASTTYELQVIRPALQIIYGPTKDWIRMVCGLCTAPAIAVATGGDLHNPHADFLMQFRANCGTTVATIGDNDEPFVVTCEVPIWAHPGYPLPIVAESLVFLDYPTLAFSHYFKKELLGNLQYANLLSR